MVGGDFRAGIMRRDRGVVYVPGKSGVGYNPDMSSDVHPGPTPCRIDRMDDATREMLRNKTPAERLAIAFECNRMMRLRLEGHFRTYHPEWSNEQILAEIARRMARGTS